MQKGLDRNIYLAKKLVLLYKPGVDKSIEVSDK